MAIAGAEVLGALTGTEVPAITISGDASTQINVQPLAHVVTGDPTANEPLTVTGVELVPTLEVNARGETFWGTKERYIKKLKADGYLYTANSLTNSNVVANWYVQSNVQVANYAWTTWADNCDTPYCKHIYQRPAISYTSETTQVTQNVWAGWTAPIRESQEEQTRRLAREAEQAKQYLLDQKKREEELAKANVRAEKLLVRELSPEQRETLLTKKYFDVDIEGKKYRVHRGTHGNVRELDSEGREVAKFCVQPDEVPTADAMLAQMLFLRYNPKEFFAKANKTDLIRRP